MPVLPGAHLPPARAARSLLPRFAPHPAALPRPPHVTCPAQVTSGDGGEPAAVSGHGYSCRLRDPVPCPEMLFIPRGGGTETPKFGDFSAPVAIGAIWTLTLGQKALEMPYGICCGFYIPIWSPPARTLAGSVAARRHLGSSGSGQSILTVWWSRGWGVEGV